MKNTRFALDDEVRLVSSKTTVGTIKQIVSILDDGNTLYLIDFPHGLKMVAEHELELNREIVQVMDNVNLSDLAIVIEVQDKMQDIIDELGLVESDHPSTVLMNACKLQRYLVSTYSIMKKYVGARSNNILANELYNGLIMGDRNYLTNYLIFIDELYYYFDVTLDADIYLESKEDEELELCCAGLGRKKYEKYFKPISLLDFDTTEPNEAVPANISRDDIDSSIIREIK